MIVARRIKLPGCILRGVPLVEAPTRGDGEADASFEARSRRYAEIAAIRLDVRKVDRPTLIAWAAESEAIFVEQQARLLAAEREGRRAQVYTQDEGAKLREVSLRICRDGIARMVGFEVEHPDGTWTDVGELRGGELLEAIDAAGIAIDAARAVRNAQELTEDQKKVSASSPATAEGTSSIGT